MLIIDTHSHYVPNTCMSMMRAFARESPDFQRTYEKFITPGADSPIRKVDQRLAEMDQAGISMSLVSLPPPGCHFGSLKVSQTCARESNDEMIDLAAGSNRRLGVLAAVPLPHLREAIKELERVAVSPHVFGIGLMTHTREWSLDRPELLPFFERAAQLNLPLVLHPAIEPVGEPSDWGIGSCLGTVFSSTLGVTRLILSGIFDKVPDLRMVVPHLGGTLPYLITRIEDLTKTDAKHDLLHYCRTNLYFDNCSFSAPALECARATVGADRIILGSDYPYRGPLSRMIADIESLTLDDGQRAAILGRTAAGVFGLE